MIRTLLVDNDDSFTFNLFHLLAQVNGAVPDVIRNDQVSYEDVDWACYDNIVLSPGPGTPLHARDVGLCRDVLERTELPVLGVCLGHQALGHACGAAIDHAPEVMHGRLSQVFHDGRGLFEKIPQGISVVRYHSLMLGADLPDSLIRTAWTRDGIIMGVRHRQRPLWGVQFHPESILTEYGRALIDNFRRLSARVTGARTRPQRASARISVVPRGDAPPRESDAWQVHHRRLSIYPDAEAVFTAVFSELPYSFWLDSSRTGPGGRFSFMGGASRPRLRFEYRTRERALRIVEPAGERMVDGSLFEFLRQWLDAHRVTSAELPFDFNSGLVGYVGYELKAECGAEDAHVSPLPDAHLLLADHLLVFDHHQACTYLVCLTDADDSAAAERWFDDITAQVSDLAPLPPPSPGGGAPVEFVLSRGKQQYVADIERCFDLIRDGETYEVCLTNQLRANVSIDPVAFYRALRRGNPAPYSSFFRFGDVAIVSSSPERFLRIDRRGLVEARPIKGTLPRGDVPERDEQLRRSLAASEKDRAENLMIVDLLRNDLGVVCEIGSVTVPALMDIESYATVHQLVSTIRGQLRPDMRAIDCVRAAFPGGSMTGAPKRRTMAIIDDLEREPRGIYSGPIGFLGLNGSADLNIVIRTAVITGHSLSIGVGGAVVALSDAHAEFDEILLKAQALVDAVVRTLHGDVRPELFTIIGADDQAM